jgi:hypothetical protein
MSCACKNMRLLWHEEVTATPGYANDVARAPTPPPAARLVTTV